MLKLIKDEWKYLTISKIHIPYEKLVILVEFTLYCPGTNAAVESGFPISNDFWTTTRGLLATDHVILNHGQVTLTTPELAPPLLTTTPHQREDVSALDRCNMHRCLTRQYTSGTTALKGVEATLITITPIDYDPILIGSIYLPPINDYFRILGAALDTIFNFNSKTSRWRF
ncbi:uncharacterized protein TNCV_3482381 [Trichonephila clavipes]|nr:uncharacterized protein TNCV_3482381 [Trichonephila clavipes]